MGQANSRSRSAPDASRPARQSAASSPTSVQRERTDSAATAASAASKRTRRSSLGRTVRGLLPHSRSAQDGPSSHVPSSSIRKRWRSSSRFTKQHDDLPEVQSTPDSGPSASPHSLPDPIPENMTVDLSPAVPVQPPCTIVANPSPTPAQASVPSFAPEVQSSADHDNQPQSQDDLVPDQSPPPHPLPGSQQDEQLADQIERDLDDFLATRRPDSAFIQGSSRDGQSPPPPAPSASPRVPQPHESLPDLQPQLPRHFQPPGPLVVVQGVVNTSDAAATQSTSRTSGSASLLNSSAPPLSHRRSSSTPLSTDERHGARNRLSAFLRRAPSQERGTPSYDPPSSTDTSSSLPDSGSSDMLSADLDSASEDQRPNDDAQDRHRPLSPGSIDVLGTLLSVAAAATAASLFSPSLGFHPNADSNAPPPTGIPRPMSPTPTAGLAGGDGFGSLPGFGLDSSASPSQPIPLPASQPREGRERIRTVWESFRDRLGLNRNPPANATDDALPSSEEQGNMRPGEIMLAEMARALNIGLGLNGDGSGTTPERAAESAPAGDNDERTADNGSAGRALPPEDSFERFLLNLQADLRIALSEGGATSSAPATGASDSGDGRSDPTEIASDTASVRPPDYHEVPIGVTDEQHPGDDDDDDMPFLQDVSDSEDEMEEDIYDDTESTRTPTPMPASSAVPPNRVDQSSPRARIRGRRGNADRAPPGINLWRLYRFQPIPASQVAGHAAATTSPLPLSPSIPTSSIPFAQDTLQPPTVRSPSASPASPQHASASADTSADPADTTSAAASPPPAGDASQNMVVPVIVVGLQSVDMGQVHGHAHPHESDITLPDSRDAHPDRISRPASASFDDGQRQSLFSPPPEGTASGSNTPRGRGNWQSRAATALRNLRPGRRNGSRGHRAAEGTGSRTFLIYVIGGYYPPNHHMVTGSDNLDSYEALWELAELLGQVKPPVATREDIDNSGLQIIKSGELEEYEREGKVASNCVERCLICLDDYDAEDDLRLMTCKHAFHRNCVDKWLQVGRNNCPACRTKGVSTPGDTAP
ncbi:hypothetical protein OH76DRAFT_1482666 [Lentinus brumalis]|uniref:RING-type domain-containing protein n=1 Tax=Lentinus brumalis TaxID=2498619 RepID=A0A371DBJ6_9APHY|nr:hypothetical protein OH76DRAFT_1482666 [Polyporus brumalis]